jgi:alkylation response protein AidB-like acyl-CoA dehydrogenase
MPQGLTTQLLLSRRDLQFLLHEWLEIESLTERSRFSGQSRADYDDVLDLAERLAEEKFAPHNRDADISEPRIEDDRVVLLPQVGEALNAFAEAGLLGTSADMSAGGMQLPTTLASAASAWFQAANTGTTGYAFLTTAAANMLIANGSAEQVEEWAVPMLEGRYFGTMCLTEPQAGSSLADISTLAKPQPDGTYRLFGSKMWISGGDHELSENIVHMVLAKTPGAPSGSKGISLFIVPRYVEAPSLESGAGHERMRNDIALVGLNHKMGNRGTVNTALAFGDGTFSPSGTSGAIGYLIGEEHRGLPYMFRMMNEARIGVGLGACAVGYTGYLKAVKYARERTQGRPLGSRDPAAPPVAIIEHPDVRRMLLAQKSYVEGGLALVLYCARLQDDAETLDDAFDRDIAERLLDTLTPIAKSWPSIWCLEANSLAIQVHGGYGYSREYDVEQHYRDNRLNAIHEGTQGIQAIDLLGRKIRRNDGRDYDLLKARIADTLARAHERGGEARELGVSLELQLDRLTAATKVLLEADDGLALANAGLYLEALGQIVVAWIWLQQFLLADGDDAFYEGKRQAARYFFRYELPRADNPIVLLAQLDSTTLVMDPSWF